MKNRIARICLLALSFFFIFSCSTSPIATNFLADEAVFTVVVIPDTQNAIHYKRQKAEGFAIDSSEVFIEQMRYIASRSISAGGDVAFVASVGDVWQHQSSSMDPAHLARGVTAIENPILVLEYSLVAPSETQNIEIPKAIEGYRLISNANIPFGVAPGNHDYDAVWSVAGFPPNMTKARRDLTDTVEDLGLVHVGGLDNFRIAFGSDTDFFRDKDWYVSGYRGGGSSAQIFSAGGYRFLHFAFEMQAGDDVLAWAQDIIGSNPGLPTLISTHDYLNQKGERKPAPILDLALGDPVGNNNAEALWRKFVRKNEQIFMVLSGHHIGQAIRIDENESGYKVYQILADYQERGQVGIDAGQPLGRRGRPLGIGDGWVREMTFYLSADKPRIDVKTYSSHYRTYSDQLDTYAQWYKDREQPDMSDTQFLAADEFTIELNDFFQRFGMPRDFEKKVAKAKKTGQIQQGLQ